MHFVLADCPSVKVRRYIVENERGVRYSAELCTQEDGFQKAIIDARSHEELGAMIEPAARAFALSVRYRLRYTRSARG